MSSFLDRVYKWAKESIVDEVLIFALILVSIETYAQYNLKKKNNMTLTILVGMLMYAFLGYFLHYSYDKFPLSKMNITWSSMSIIIAGALGYFAYDEDLNIYKLLSIVFALLAVYFMSIS